MWNWKCPNCKQDITEAYKPEEVKKYVGATHDCPVCGYTVQIEPDLTVSDFGEFLIKEYAKMGVTVTKEEALGNFIEF